MILDDLVLDVTQFASCHPGGRFVIDKNIGRDASKYFHGGYSYEASAKNHAHSNYARTIVNSLIVARYTGKRDIATMAVRTADNTPTSDSAGSEEVRTFNLDVQG